MTALQTSQYHGYDTVANRQWSSWCACIYPTRADLPILPSSILRTLACQKSDAIAEAKHAIDRVLSRCGDAAEAGRTWQ
jgi:hypothetical protein